MGRKEIELEAERLLEPALKQLGIELVAVSYTHLTLDFLRYAGEEVDVKLFAPLEEVGGVKAFTAVLDGLSDDGQIMLIFQDKPITLGKDKISQIRIHFSF